MISSRERVAHVPSSTHRLAVDRWNDTTKIEVVLAETVKALQAKLSVLELQCNNNRSRQGSFKRSAEENFSCYPWHNLSFMLLGQVF